ncbi:MAG TPA: carbamoyltransferase HypF [Terriglobales bacterium]|nr:carbamoyltransferase HypF [Terriglobales bacterium]
MSTKAQPGSLVRKRIQITGVVQGVGFRPYIYRLAKECGLAGTVLNDSAGVDVEVEGDAVPVEKFIARVRPEAPPLSKIVTFDVSELPVHGDREFRIVMSHGTQEQKVLISPDVAVCQDCLREMFDPHDRRYKYPFINCTNCGPRFTIVRDIPYDRPLTSMAVFPMCPECQREYDDPANRRFHAQPNACWKCGPQVQLWDATGKAVTGKDPVGAAVARLRAGEIVAIKGLGGFHLAVDATNNDAVERLRQRKRRFEKPLAIMVPDVETAQRYCELPDESRRVMESVQRPIVLLRRKVVSQICQKPAGMGNYQVSDRIAESVAPGIHELGVFLPYTPLHHLIFAAGKFKALVMTSANLSEEPIAIDNQEALQRLGDIADWFLVHNREILIRSDDSVVRVSGAKIRQIRRSRGFVPMPVFLNRDLPPVLAVGGELKNTICLTRAKTAFLSQHVGDLENMESFGFFEETVEHLTRILEIEPQAVAYDLHPDYLSTKWALEQKGKKLIGVQHHHAHIASCMAENGLDESVIGFSLDGTGYGTDGKIWGGEVLIADYTGFERAAHFEYIPLPGGAAAIHEPWRMAVSYLRHHFGAEFANLDIPFVRSLDLKKLGVVVQMLQKGIHSPLTSSCGRLFDAVAALAGIRNIVSYEGQAAIQLENTIVPGEERDAYEFEICEQDGTRIIHTRQLFEAMVRDLCARVERGVIARRFHDGLVRIFAEVAEAIRKDTGLRKVCLSGGTFQNLYLAENLQRRLELAGFEVLTQSEVPCNDGGLSLGQAMIAASQLRS